MLKAVRQSLLFILTIENIHVSRLVVYFIEFLVKFVSQSPTSCYCLSWNNEARNFF